MEEYYEGNCETPTAFNFWICWKKKYCILTKTCLFLFSGKICKDAFDSPQAVNKHKRSAHSEIVAAAKAKKQQLESDKSGDLVRT